MKRYIIYVSDANNSSIIESNLIDIKDYANQFFENLRVMKEATGETGVVHADSINKYSLSNHAIEYAKEIERYCDSASKYKYIKSHSKIETDKLFKLAINSLTKCIESLDKYYPKKTMTKYLTKSYSEKAMKDLDATVDFITNNSRKCQIIIDILKNCNQILTKIK